MIDFSHSIFFFFNRIKFYFVFQINFPSNEYLKKKIHPFRNNFFLINLHLSFQTPYIFTLKKIEFYIFSSISSLIITLNGWSPGPERKKERKGREKRNLWQLLGD